MSDDETRGEYEGREYKVSKAIYDGPGYPSSHTWGEFAGMAIELGGYSDVTAIDPYTGRRFWLSGAFRCNEHVQALQAAKPGDEAIAVYVASGECPECNCTFFGAVRRLLDAMEAANFMGGAERTEAPNLHTT